MMAHKFSVAALVLLVIVGGLLVAGQWSLHQRSQEVCGICARHINPQAGVIAEIGGRRHHVCCAHCAVTEGLQEHKPVRLIEVADYNTGRKLDPSRAWYVDGSRIVACEHDMTRMGEMKQVQQAAFDRCSPGTFAFATRGDADTFAAKNGGSVLRMEEMLAGVNAGEAKQ
jgi:nitrous oxide reductase accessory protein NosL